MKKILAILLALVFTLSAMTLTACDTGDTETTETTEAETTAPETTDTEAPTNGGDSNTGSLKENTLTGGTEVQNLNGKTAYQLYTEAGTKLSGTTEFRMEMSQTSATESTQMIVHLTDSTAYQKIKSSSYSMEGWYVGGYTYQTSNSGEKVKYEDTIDDAKSSCQRYVTAYYIPNLVESKFENVKLMKTDSGICYFSVEITGEEASALSMGSEGFTYTMAFDKDGVICQIEIVTTEAKIVIVYDLDDIADVTAPADASSYKENGSNSGSSSGGTSGGDSSIVPPNGNNNEPQKVGNIYVGDMDGDGDVDDFDIYIQARGDYYDSDQNGIVSIDDVLEDMPADMYQTALNVYAKEYAGN